MAAVTLALVLLLALGVPCLAADTNGGGTRGPESSVLDSLRHLEQRLQHLEQRLEQQQLKTTYQERTLQKQQLQMSRQEDTIQKQNLQNSRQDEMLQEQTLKITQQEEMLKGQTTKIRQQAQVIRQLLQDKQQKTSQVQALDPKSSEAKPRVSDASAEHNRSSRSDDLDPLQATVLRLDQTVTQLTAQTQALSSKTDAASASAFVRWGHAHCPDHADLVYSGVVGGGYYSHTGAATNYLCLTLKPTFSDLTMPSQYHAYLYGAEYSTFDSHQNKDPVCAVCRARLPTTVMVPGTDRCSEGWTVQYSGYLMAGRYEHAAGSEYVCVDDSLQSRLGGTANDDGALLYFVTTECGSLPCDPYVNHKVVRCVVCSQ